MEEHEGHAQRIAHGYFDIDLDLVWRTIQTALPTLVVRLLAIRSEPSGDIGA